MKSLHRGGVSFRWCIVVALLFTVSCKEEFPPYAEPRDVLRGEISQSSPDTVLLRYDQDLDMYFLESLLAFNVRVTNQLEDLLQGAAQVEGTITVHAISDIPRVVNVPLRTGNLLQPPVFQGNIALPPGRSAEFSTLWLPIAVDGEMVFEGLTPTPGPGGSYYGPITFIAEARVQLFERVQPITFGNLTFQRIFNVR